MAIGEIVSITIVSQLGTKEYTVGNKTGGWLKDVSGRIIGSIRERSLEYENSCVTMYHVYDTDGDLIASVENCPVDVMYAKPEREAKT